MCGLDLVQIHVTFSMYGGDGQALVHGLQTNMVQIFLQSVGVVLTDIQDVVFKLAHNCDCILSLSSKVLTY